MQPDSLKLSSQLAMLKLLHKTAFKLDETLGDKSSGRTYFLRGIQGQVSHPVWNRDYFYLNGKIQEVREYMRENCVHTVAEELLTLALDIFSRSVDPFDEEHDNDLNVQVRQQEEDGSGGDGVDHAGLAYHHQVGGA